MKHLLYILCLFVFSCDDGGDGCVFNGDWVGVTATITYSNECNCGGGVGTCEDDENDISCRIITFSNDTMIIDDCECGTIIGPIECIDIEEFDCNGNVIGDDEFNCTRNADTITCVSTIEDNESGEGCIRITTFNYISD